MSYAIVFSSKTGNTRLLADTLRASLPQNECTYFGAPAPEALEAETLYIGFWTDKGHADDTLTAFLQTLKGKRVFLFGTAGFGGSAEYFEQILAAVQKSLDESNTVIGTYMCQGKMPMTVAPGIKTGINLRYENPRELGSDRIANAVAAQAEYGGPCIFIDFGTATTFGAIDHLGAFAGGCICPGLKLTSEALVSGTAKLPRFELVKPDHVISRTTVTNLQAGVIYGYIGQVNYLVQRFRKELGAPDALVVATGGMARLVADEVGTIDKLDGILTLKGLRLIYERNR